MDNLSWKEKLNQFKIPIALSILGLVLLIGGVFASGLDQQKGKVFPKESLVDTSKIISVDVSGAVNKPGVYQLSVGSRIGDAIVKAGGFTQDANQEYISKTLNLAQKLSDGSKVYVPAEGERGSGIVAGTNISARVNINTASQAELEALPDIGVSRALKIISGRQYGVIEDLVSKKIISQSIFEKIKDLISVY